MYDVLTTDINKIYIGNQVNVYPNPIKEVLNVDLKLLKENTLIEIYDSVGKLVFNKKIGNLKSSFSLHHLESGIYFYRILAGEQLLKTDKIVIIK